MASVFVSIALLEMAIIGTLAIAQTYQNLTGLEEATGQIVKIGAIYNLEGSQSPLDLPSARGARLAVQEINAHGGIDGREIELILCDGKSDPAKVRECAKGLLNENVSAMMGLSDTDMVLAALPAAAGAGIPFVTSGATSPGLAEEYRGLFLACFGDNVQAAAGAEYAYNKMGLKTCALLADGDMEYARLLAGYFKERYLDLRGKIVMEANINGTDLMNLSRAVRDKNPDMIYLAARPDEAGAMVVVMRRAGVQSPVFGGDSLDSAELRREGMGRIVFSTHALIDERSPSTGMFAKAYRAEYGHPPENAFSALGYDTVNLLADAIDRAGSGDPQAILKALDNTSGFKGVTGEISYQNGSRIPNKGVTMVLLNNGKVVGSEVVMPEPTI
jgi:branched-chain amino acid transport system substrate-binding protein